MKASMSFLLRVAQVVLTLSLLAGVASAQSGRSWMGGFIFADSDTTGLPGATVETGMLNVRSSL